MIDLDQNHVHLDEECFLRQKVVYTPKKRSANLDNLQKNS